MTQARSTSHKLGARVTSSGFAPVFRKRSEKRFRSVNSLNRPAFAHFAHDGANTWDQRHRKAHQRAVGNEIILRGYFTVK
jgi:hypothetical protein